MMCMRFKNEEVLFYTAHGKTYDEARIALQIYKEAMDYDEEFTRTETVY